METGAYCGRASSRCSDCCSSPAQPSETRGWSSLIGRSSWTGEPEQTGGGASARHPRLLEAKHGCVSRSSQCSHSRSSRPLLTS